MATTRPKSAARPAPQAAAPAAAAHDAFRTAQAWMNETLQAMHRSGRWLEQLEQLNRQGLAAWVQIWRDAAQESAAAADAAALWAVPTRLAQRQIELAARRLSDAWTATFELEKQWAEEARSQVVGLGEHLPEPVAAAWPLTPATDAEFWDLWARLQDQWLKLPQRLMAAAPLPESDTP